MKTELEEAGFKVAHSGVLNYFDKMRIVLCKAMFFFSRMQLKNHLARYKNT